MKIKTLAASAIVLAVSAATSPVHSFEELGKVKLAPMERPADPVVGTKLHWLKNGKEHISEVVAVDEESVSGINSEGCEYRALKLAYAPTLEWKNCTGSTGGYKIKKAKGSPWPMTAKTKFNFRADGKTTKGDSWSRYRRCKVKKQVRIKVPAGEFDTNMLHCTEESGSWTRWISPELGHEVAIKRKLKSSKSRSYLLELVKVEDPS